MYHIYTCEQHFYFAFGFANASDDKLAVPPPLLQLRALLLLDDYQNMWKHGDEIFKSIKKRNKLNNLLIREDCGEVLQLMSRHID
jgi:hypothetical protein